jgi:hypothetical protein
LPANVPRKRRQPMATPVSETLQLGSGWIGGFVPFIATAIVIATWSIFGGLWYTVVIAGLNAIVRALVLPETRGRDINA